MAFFALIMRKIRVKVPLPPCEALGFEGRRCRLQGSKPRAPWVGGAAFVGRRYGLQDPWGLSL